ncbi:hypothetical protein HYU06_00115 [Candidatus Woesearchaeota archaeon]|nr:hypothetical protein [Candidatus Woesearchaeota archaeon]
MALDSVIEKAKTPETVQPKKKLEDYFVEDGFWVIEETALTADQNKWISHGIYRYVATILNTEARLMEGHYKVLPPSSTVAGSYLNRKAGILFYHPDHYVSAEELITNLIGDAEGDPLEARYLVVKRKHGAKQSKHDAKQYKIEIYKKPLPIGDTSDQRRLSYQLEHGKLPNPPCK